MSVDRARPVWVLVRGGALAGALALAPFLAHAQENAARTAVEKMLATHKLVLAADNEFKAAENQARVALGDWFPSLDTTAGYGFERQAKGEGTADTNIHPREFSLKITQLLWDFGATNAAVRRAALGAQQKAEVAVATRQMAILEGLSAHITLAKALRVVNFAKASEANIKRQAELEDARVQEGSGFTTDVLQAKTQLAAAQSRRIQAEGARFEAVHRYRAVFGNEPPVEGDLPVPQPALDSLPKTITSAVDTSLTDNPQLKASQLSAEIAREDVNRTEAAEFMPKLQAVGESRWKDDYNGTIGTRIEQLIKVEVKHSFNLGLTAVNSLKASEQTHVATEQRYAFARDQIEEQARNAWRKLDTARANAEALRTQAEIASAFLELARKERQLGQRSLIDVLAGETALINAKSDAAAAEADVALATYNLLAIVGSLDLDQIR